ncbi:hypothetical protein [Streptomyces sp. ISL-87]|uniref:hypothetical protein n=1 Tax=unclassified Streptomyces TaxID=2593676 RepID=UPI0035ABDB3B
MITGMQAHEFARLLTEAEQYILDHPPISLHHSGPGAAPCAEARPHCPTGSWSP